MQLFSIQFFLFVVILFILYYTVLKKVQWVCLLAGSLVFFCMFGVQNLIYILITSFSIWLGAKGLDAIVQKYNQDRKREGITKEEKKALKAQHLKKKRIVLILLLLLNFGILGYFKYWNGIVDAIAGVASGGGSVYTQFHLEGLLLPLGISFYTFQSIGYLADVYNKKVEPEKNYLKFLLFVCYFPQLLQGPINRFSKMASQLFERHTIDAERCGRALLLFAYGALKKYAIAELLVGNISMIFDYSVKDLSGPMIVFGILMYAAQLYGDFSGGIDMVLAVSELFGIEMMPNFRQPYFATSLADFWRRWHISLGAWMRDYVFYPFALTKPMQRFSKFCGKKLNKHLGRVLPAALANILVFALVGIWHGAASNFLLWGLYNGIVIAISDVLRPVFEKWNVALHINTKSKGFHVFRIIRTFIIVMIGWYIDRIEGFDKLVLCFKNTFAHPDFQLTTVQLFITKQYLKTSELLLLVIILALIIVFITSILKENNVDVWELLHRAPAPCRIGIYLVMGILILFAVSYANGSGGFLYANF